MANFAFALTLYPGLTIDDTALETAGNTLSEKAEEMRELKRSIESCFELLRTDWDTDAGRAYFERLDNQLFKHLDNHANVIEHISENLKIASDKYDAVFRAAENAAIAEYRRI
jgi:WXG100 family type VII secretion target